MKTCQVCNNEVSNVVNRTCDYCGFIVSPLKNRKNLIYIIVTITSFIVFTTCIGVFY